MVSNRPQAIQAAIFDMDGVVTQTMHVHYAAWQQVLDNFLRAYAPSHDQLFLPFTFEDYFSYVDGVPRLEGIRRFLASRGITVSEGEPDSFDGDTVHGLGNLKNQRFQAWLDVNSVPTYADALELIRALKQRGIKVGIFSASRNSERVLTSAGVTGLFDVKVDGLDVDRLALPPKPHPAMLIETLKRLGTKPARAIVIEDSVSGVRAGSAAAFRHVVGVDREPTGDDDHGCALRKAGADLVTRDLTEVLALCDLVVSEART